MKKKVWVFLAHGFEEIEAITVIDLLRRAGIEVVMIGLQEGPITGSRGVRVLADIPINLATGVEFDMIVLPGGAEGTNNLRKDKRIERIIKEAVKQKKWVAAICAAPSLLTEYLRWKKATSHPSVRSMMSGVTYEEKGVVIDDYFVTSRAPGTAMAFAFALIRILAGDERVRAVNAGVMADIDIE
jgi:4-methyl-5(b-hydroxyethyl)-thiazole monophosphate biosynthesis